MTHTPTPWRRGQSGNLRIYGPDNAGEHSGLIAEIKHRTAPGAQPANAEFIVTAVNSHDGLLEALEKIEPSIGWRGTGKKSIDGYYCECCKAYHEDDRLIEHRSDCPVLLVRAAIKAAKGLGAEDEGTLIPHHGSGP